MNEPIHRSDWVLESFVDEVRGCPLVEDWEFDNDLVTEIAQLLWDYKNDTLAEDKIRELYKKTKPKKSKHPLDKLATWAEEGEALLSEINVNPYLIDALSPVYQEALKDWPEEVLLMRQNYSDKTLDIYSSETTPPPQADLDIAELSLRLNRLALACREAKAPNDLPVFKPGRKKTNDKLGFVATALDEMLSKHIETAIERRACILELLPLVGAEITDKALHDML